MALVGVVLEPAAGKEKEVIHYLLFRLLIAVLEALLPQVMQPDLQLRPDRLPALVQPRL